MNPSSSPTLFFAHANGIPGPCYQVLFRSLAPFQTDFIPIMGQRHAQPSNWEALADEIIQHLETHHQEPVVGIGHSFGGVGIFFAARRRPELFSRVVVLDPPLFGWQRRWLAAPFQWFGLAHRVVPPAKKALRRRDQFESKEAAREYFSSKPFFQRFHPEAFEDYLTFGLTNTDHGLTLTIPKEKEAQYFAVFPRQIGSATLPIPAHYVIPEGSIIPSNHLPQLKRRFSSWTWHEVAGSHIFPLEHPEASASLIKDMMGMTEKQTRQ